MNSRIERLKLNKRLLFGAKFFTELKSLNSVIQLFYLSRGMDLGQVVYLSLIWTITIFAFDIPSSFLADRFGRKRIILLGLFLTSISTFLLFFGSGFLYISFVYAISAIGYSFYTGTDQAILYDSLKELGEEKNISKVSGKYFSAQSLPKIIVPLIGSFIAKDLLGWQFMVLIVIDFVGTLIAVIVATQLTEPKNGDVPTQKINLLREGFNLIKSDKILLKLALNKIIVFQASFVYWRIYQVFLKGAGMPIIYLGLIYTVFQGIQFLILWNTEKVQNFLGKVNFANLNAAIGVLSILVSLFSSNLILLFLSCVAILLTGVTRDPFFLTQMQARIPSFNRATATSTLNTIKNITDIPILLLIGFLAKLNTDYVLIVSAVLFLVPIFLIRIKKEDLAV